MSRNDADVDVADSNEFVDDEKMSVIADFCVSNVINHIIEKSHLKREIDLEKLDFNSDEMSLFMSFMNESSSERDSSVHIERMAFSIISPHGSASFNNSRIRTVSMLEYHKHSDVLQRSAICASFDLSILSSQYSDASSG